MTAGAQRLAEAFARRPGATGLIPFVTAGYPSLDRSLAIMRALASRAIALEVGVPFSDPIADGAEIQRASEAALRAGIGPEEALELVAAFRAVSPVPVVLMTYANPVVRIGLDAFAPRARAAGVDGMIVSDLPPEESPEVWAALDRNEIATILLVAPTTAPQRLPRLLARCRGFVYCLARTGVTGRSAGTSAPITERIRSLREATALPIAVGFGISSAATASPLRGVADAVVVGAAFMRAVADAGDAEAVARVEALAGEIAGALA